MFNPTYDSISSQIDSLTGLIERQNERLDNLNDCRLTERRARRIERLENSISQRNDRLAALEEKLQSLSPVISEEATDYMEVDFWQDPLTGTSRGLTVSITDSSFDDTYIGGSPLTAVVSGSTSNGSSTTSFSSKQSGFISSNTAPIDDTIVYAFGMSQSRIDGTYSDVIFSLISTTCHPFFIAKFMTSPVFVPSMTLPIVKSQNV